MSIATPAELERLLNGVGAEPQWCSQFWRGLNDRLGSVRHPRFRLQAWGESCEEEGDDPSIFRVRWDSEDTEVFLHSALFNSDSAKVYLLDRAFMVVVAMSFVSHWMVRRKTTVACLSDVGAEGLVSFTGRAEMAKLIPDPRFLGSFAYHRFKLNIDERWVPWASRKPAAFWRGGLHGTVYQHDRIRFPRVDLCNLALRSTHRGHIDAKITGVDPYIQRAHADRLAGLESIMGERVEPERQIGYRYLIDIDGWANAWSGLFQKLLTGSTVLKVASQKGFRQWYYDRLEPWVHYVPVRADLADLDDAVAFVLTNDGRAQEIGEAGRRLVLSLSLESEVYGMARWL